MQHMEGLLFEDVWLNNNKMLILVARGRWEYRDLDGLQAEKYMSRYATNQVS